MAKLKDDPVSLTVELEYEGVTSQYVILERYEQAQRRIQALEKAAQALIDYRDRAGALGFQLEKADDHINALRKALEAQ